MMVSCGQVNVELLHFSLNANAKGKIMLVVLYHINTRVMSAKKTKTQACKAYK